MRTIGEVARLAGVTVRTLHHYDAIGVVRPSGRTDGGYRLYDDADLARLQTVLFYRELGFGLGEIVELMSAPSFDRARALRDHHELLSAEVARIRRVLDAVDEAIDAEENGGVVSDEAMFAVFDPEEHERRREAERRWGDTHAYRESRRRTRHFTEDDWRQVEAETEQIMTRLTETFTAGAAADSTAAMDAVEDHREQIGHRFYPCSHRMQLGLADMYVEDERFRATYEQRAEGLAQWVHDAVTANARRAGA